MIGLPATIAWYVFLFLMLWGFQRLTRCFSRLTIFSLFIGFLVLRHGITVPFDHTVNHWFAGIDISPQAFQRYYISLVLMWLCLLAGVWLARAYLGRAQVNPETFRLEMSRKRLPAGVNGWFLPILVIGVGLIVVFELRFDTSLNQLLSGHFTAAQYREMRDVYGQATHYSLGLGYRLASIVRFGLLPMFVYTLYYLSNRGIFYKILFACALSLGLFLGLISGQKSPSIFLAMGLIIAFYYRRGNLRLKLTNWRLLLAVGAAWLALLPFLYHLQYPGSEYPWLLRSTTYRLTSEYDRSLQLYFQIYPDIQPHLHGQSSSLIDALLGIKMRQEDLPECFIPTYYLGPDYLNTWNAAYLGVAWADFGYAGVVLESLFVGALLQAYAYWFSRTRKTALVMGTQVALIMAATKLSEVALTASLLSFGLLTCFLVFLCVQALRRRKRTCPNPHGIEHANPSSCT